MQRQGDLLVKKIQSFPQGLKEVKSGIVVRGESTGHAHKLVGGQVFSGANGVLYLQVAGTAKLVHEEHKPLTLRGGKYAVIRQREYTSADMTRLVVD